MPASVFLKDSDLKYIAINESYSKMLNITANKLIGKRYTYFFPDEQFVEEIDYEIITTSKPKLNIEVKFKNKWLQISKVPFFGENNKVAGIVGIITDITELKQKEQ